MPIISIATFNVGSLYSDYESNLAALERLLGSVSPDVLCLQELPDDRELIEKIKSLTGLEHCIYRITSESHVNEGGNMGIAILTRVPAEPCSVLKLDKPTVEIYYNGRQEYWHDKYYIAARADIGGSPVLLVTGHGFPFHRYNLECAEGEVHISPCFAQLESWLLSLAGENPDAPLLIMADLNITDALDFMPALAHSHFDIFKGQATRPYNRKTDAVIVPHATPVRTVENLPVTGYDHHYISAEIDC